MRPYLPRRVQTQVREALAADDRTAEHLALVVVAETLGLVGRRREWPRKADAPAEARAS